METCLRTRKRSVLGEDLKTEWIIFAYLYGALYTDRCLGRLPFPRMQNNTKKKDFFEKITTSVGSVPSLAVHTIFFIAAFTASTAGFISWTSMLLIITTLVSLEAIYLAIFIQMTVNRHAHELQEVSDDVEDIQEDLEEMSEDVEGLEEHVEGLHENIEGMSEEEKQDEIRKKKQAVSLEQLTADVRKLLTDIEEFKKR